MHITHKIERIKEKMATLSPNSQAYFAYSDILKELNQMKPAPVITLHKDEGPTCTSCE